MDDAANTGPDKTQKLAIAEARNADPRYYESQRWLDAEIASGRLDEHRGKWVVVHESKVVAAVDTRALAQGYVKQHGLSWLAAFDFVGDGTVRVQSPRIGPPETPSDP